MKPSSPSIEKAIEALKAAPGVFQRLIEDYAEISYPQVFSHLAPTGRRPDDLWAPGWPDAWCFLPDGRRAVVEATHSKDWARHLEDDVRRVEALKPGLIGAFLFAAWAKTPEAERLESFRDRLVAQGLPSECIFLVFREQLVRDLSHPRFARQWIDPLGLSPFSDPFLPISSVPTLFSPEGEEYGFVPSRSEYQEGRVHRPALIEVVEERLDRLGWVLVRGVGASGKTVLATSMALGPAYRNRVAYYFDLAESQDESGDEARSLESLTVFGDRGTLFIVDNVHLLPDVARRLFDAWRDLATGSRLLLLSRFVTPNPDHRGRSHPLADLETEGLELKVESMDLVGVCRRLLCRYLRRDDVPEPPPQAIASWARLFGGDLLAFSTAVMARLHDFTRGKWVLQPEDAGEYIRAEYLTHLQEVEVRALTRLAVLAELELTGTPASLGREIPYQALKKGLVLRLERGARRHLHFRLVHPGMGTLLLRSFQGIHRPAVLRDIAAADSMTGIVIARRLSADQNTDEARALLQTIVRSPVWFSAAFQPPYLAGTFKLFDSLNVQPLWKPEDWAPHLADLMEAVRRTPLGSLTSFLKLWATRDGFRAAVYPHLIADLMTGNGLQFIAEAARRAPFDSLVTFLQLSRSKTDFLPAYQYVTASLASNDGLQAIAENAWKSPFNLLLLFLQFIHKNVDFRHIYEHLVPSLSSREGLRSLAATAQRTSFDLLISFLIFTQRSSDLLPVYENLVAHLTTGDGLQALGENAKQASLHALRSILKFTRDNSDFQPAYHHLVSTLASRDGLQSVAATAQITPFNFLIPFLRFTLESKDLLPVHENLIITLTTSAGLQAVTANALRTPLHFIVPFLEFTHDNTDFRRIYDHLVATFASHDGLQAVAEGALRVPLDFLAFSLEFAHGNADFRPAYDHLVATLASPSSLQALTESAQRSALNSIAAFLQLAHAHPDLRPVYGHLVDSLATNDALRHLAATVERAPLSVVTPFLNLLRENVDFQPAYEYITSHITTPSGLEAMTESAGRASVDHLASFLQLARDEKRLQPLYHHISAAMVPKDRLQVLTESSQVISLAEVSSFLQFARDDEKFRHAYDYLITALSTTEGLRALAENAQRSPLEHLTSFLRFIRDDEDTQHIYYNLIESILAAADRSILLDNVRGAPLDHLATFLQHASSDEISRPIYEYLVSWLAEGEGLQLLTKKLFESDLDKLSAFLNLRQLAERVFKAIDLESWNARWALQSRMNLNSLSTFTRELINFGRPELAAAPARVAILKVPHREWHRSGVQLTTLSFALRATSDIETEQLDRFLEAVATPAWLKHRYHLLYPGALAGALFSIWSTLEARRFKHFQTFALREEMKRKIFYSMKDDLRVLAPGICLLGVSALAGVRMPVHSVSWLKSSHIRGLLLASAPNPDLPLGPIQAQLWLGLRELGHLHRHLRVPPEEGHAHLERLQGAVPVREKLQRLNRIMVAWLEACRAAGWQLVRDTTPLPE